MLFFEYFGSFPSQPSFHHCPLYSFIEHPDGIGLHMVGSSSSYVPIQTKSKRYFLFRIHNAKEICRPDNERGHLPIVKSHFDRISSAEWPIGFWWGNRREIDHWGDPDVDGGIILRWIFRKWEGVVGTGWSWLRIGTGGGHWWVRWWTFGFRKMRGISWLAAEPVSFSRRTLLHGVSK